MESPGQESGDMLEQTLLQCYDKEAVAKLLDKGMKRADSQAQWDEGEDGGSVAKRSKRSSGSQGKAEEGSMGLEGREETVGIKTCKGVRQFHEEIGLELSGGCQDEEETRRGALKVFQAEKEYLVSKVSMLEAELKTEKSYRVHYEDKSHKLGRNAKKMEDVVISQKIQIRALKQQPSNAKIDQMKAKMLIRIGDIEKDTIETKAAVVSELKNISDIKKPLENVTKLVEFLKTELENRDKKICDYENLLGERREEVAKCETGVGDSSSASASTELNKNSLSVEVSDDLNHGAYNQVETEDEVKTKEDKLKSMKEALELNQETILSLNADLYKLTSKNKKIKDKKEVLGKEYDELERYLTKIEMKLDKRESKLEKLSSENESCQFEIESLKELNDNLLKQLAVLKEENILLKDTIAQKEAKLLRSDLKLKLSKEELKLDVEDSYKLREERMKNEAAILRRDQESANLKINNLLQSKHRLEIELENQKLEIYTSVRNQKVEMKKMRKIHESSARQLSNTIKLLKMQLEEQQDNTEINNNNKVNDNVEQVKRGLSYSDDTQFNWKEREGEGDETSVVDDAMIKFGKKVNPEYDVKSETELAREVGSEVVKELIVKAVEM